ncbi:hypothetical protein CI109_105543 [Kwoniella shandongensis]|uniref:Uncharacterized protein n=1 Tax=Kwoniella shandongensis TaxID=1734106 RepID=A0A5M6C834_9TREE|nr:uncharacterized protein CI109_002262 [Kwoniella shandongensis]KAA5529369.1 hypothetical protein CI109_002262 [Kwoniella shandongensis]
MAPQLSKRGCAYHLGNTSGKTYDSNGKECALMTSADKLALGIVLSICGVVLIVLAGIYTRRWYKSRDQTARATVDRPMSSIGSPLIPRRPQLSLSCQSSYLPSSPLSGSSSDMTHGSDSSSGTPSLYSPYSPNPENFHFPILSADGHLLPPAPASVRSFVEVPIEPAARPLPAAPLSTVLVAPIPKSTQRWSYSPVSEGHGLFSGVEIRGDGSVEVVRDDYDIETTSNIMSSPTISRVSHQAYQPQQATYHQTFSAEGDDLSLYDYASDEGYRRY